MVPSVVLCIILGTAKLTILYCQQGQSFRIMVTGEEPQKK
jgi:hypothetical protein